MTIRLRFGDRLQQGLVVAVVLTAAWGLSVDATYPERMRASPTGAGGGEPAADPRGEPRAPWSFFRAGRARE